MKYFNELLESYNRLKKRKLNLLEQAVAQVIGSTPEQRKDDMISKVKAGGEAYTEQNPLVLNFGQKVFQGWINSKGRVSIFYNKYRYSPEVRPAALLPHLESGEIEGASDQKGQGDQTQPDQNAMGQGLAGQGQPTSGAKPKISWWDVLKMNKLLGLITGADGKTKLGKSGLLRRMLKPFGNDKEGKQNFISRILKRFKGDLGNYSIARAIDQHVLGIVDENGNIEVAEAGEDDNSELKNIVNNTMIRVLELLNKNKISEADCKEIKRSIIMTTQNRLIIKESIDKGQGVVINDRSGDISDFFQRAANVHGCQLEKKRIGSVVGSDEAYRGKLMEDMVLINHYIMLCNDNTKVQGNKKKECFAKLESLISEWESEKEKNRKVFEKLEEIDQKYDGNFAIPLGSNILGLEELRRIFGPNASEILLKRIQSFSTQEYKIRRPDYVIPMGDVVGEGQRADTLEVYDSRESALAALQRQGIRPEIAEMIVQETDMNSICSEASRGIHCPEDLSRPYFAVSVSLKNYLNFKDGAHLGTLSDVTRRTILSGKFCKDSGVKQCTPEEIERVTKFRKIIGETLGLEGFENPKSDISKRIAKMESEMEKVDSLCDDLGNKVAFDSDGELNVDSLKKTCKTLVDKLSDTYDFDELTSDDLSTYLKDNIDSWQKDGKINHKKLKALISSCLQGQIIKSKLAKGEIDEHTARAYVGSTIMLAGGSSDNALLSARSLQYGDLLVCPQNEVFSVLKDWIAGKSDFELKMSINGRKFELKDPKTGRRLGFSTRIKSSGSRTHVAEVGLRQLEHVAGKQVDRAKAEEQDKINGTEDAVNQNNPQLAHTINNLGKLLVEDKSILEYIVNQQKVLENLILSITKGALH